MYGDFGTRALGGSVANGAGWETSRATQSNRPSLVKPAIACSCILSMPLQVDIFGQSVYYSINTIPHIPFTEIDNQSEFQFGQAKVGKHLSFKNGIPFDYRFVINQHELFNPHVQPQWIS